MKLALRADDDLFPNVILNSLYSFLLSLRATSHMLSMLALILLVLATYPEIFSFSFRTSFKFFLTEARAAYSSWINSCSFLSSSSSTCLH
jgi:hypothetical protein